MLITRFRCHPSPAPMAQRRLVAGLLGRVDAAHRATLSGLLRYGWNLEQPRPPESAPDQCGECGRRHGAVREACGPPGVGADAAASAEERAT